MIRSHAAPGVLGMHPSFDALMEITSRPPVVFVEGRGSWLRDQSGKDYLDFVQGWAVNCLGHCPDAITNAIAAQAARLLNCSPSFYNEPMIRLSELIARHSGLHQTFFTNSGAEAIEGAIKLARKWGAKISQRRLRDHHHGSRLPWANVGGDVCIRQTAMGAVVRAKSAGISQSAT
jgi:acetylornithine/succinyldiaminopimelate/putrescine aminotransferase